LLIWPGQFLFGYPEQDDEGSPGNVAEAPVEWMSNGSFLVFRRLQQNVEALHNFAASQAPQISASLGRTVTEADVLAWIVGRWPDGEPLVRCPVQPSPGSATMSEAELNHFDYATAMNDTFLADGTKVTASPADNDGFRCPHFAHIRKVNLRDKLTDKGVSTRFRMLRRGIPYGPAWQQGEAPGIDRGLLFVSYQQLDEQRLGSRRQRTRSSCRSECGWAPGGSHHSRRQSLHASCFIPTVDQSHRRRILFRSRRLSVQAACGS
jgi:deferrochelatase/peroxidase EfeB